MNDWQTWRKQQRSILIADRAAIEKKMHTQWSLAITTHIQNAFPMLDQKHIGIYWPIRNEYDPRPLAQYFIQQGATTALPVIINRHNPLVFHEWWHDAPITKGAYGIPIPQNTKRIMPDVLIIPMLGFDKCGYRLGYGSGYYDRTLAALTPKPMTIGISFEILRLDNIHPQDHDIALDFVVTEQGVYESKTGELAPIDMTKNIIDV